MVELFHGPTLAFKDIAMGLLLNLVRYFLLRKQQRVNVLVATSGDTGPACAFSCGGLGDAITCWILYPHNRISSEQELQMIALGFDNVHIIRVDNSVSDDLDIIVQRLDADAAFKQANHLTSVNSINVARVLVQTVHFFYSYFRVQQQRQPEQQAEQHQQGSHSSTVNVVVPTGACGNVMGGTIARMMGLPIDNLVVATNSNDICHQLFSTGTMRRREQVAHTHSNAMDIVVPYNLWRFLYYVAEENSELLTQWMAEFESTNQLTLSGKYRERLTHKMLSGSLNNQSTLDTVRSSTVSIGHNGQQVMLSQW
jgi:threonine synthase